MPRYLLWLLLPVISGIAAYQLRLCLLKPSTRILPPAPEQAGTPPRTSRIANPMEVFAAVVERAEALREPQEPVDFKTSSSAALHNRIETARRKNPSTSDWWTDHEVLDSVEELGRREGRDGAAWVEKQNPRLLSYYMRSWTETDPGAALDFLTSTKQRQPCEGDTLSKILAHACEQGPQALFAAVGKIPWPLFEPFDERYEIPLSEHLGTMVEVLPLPQPLHSSGSEPMETSGSKDAGLQGAYEVWIESGAARYLEEQGVPISLFFTKLGRLEPDRALSLWVSWDLSPELASNALLGCLGARENENEIAQTLRALHADPATSEKTLRSIERLISSGGSREVWNKIVPDLVALIPPDTAENNH